MSGRRGKRISEAAFRRLWLDKSLTIIRIAEMLDITHANVSARAKRRGLPSRNGANDGARPRKIDCAEFAAMWFAPVEAKEIARHYGVSLGTIYNTAKRNRLAPRGAHLWNVLSLAEYQERRMIDAMAASAKETAAAMRLSEMVDTFQPARWAGKAA